MVDLVSSIITKITTNSVITTTIDTDLPIPPTGYGYLVSSDLSYLKSSDGYYLLTKI